MRGLIRRTTVGVAAAAALLAATPMSTASAYPTTVTGTFCGARGTFAATAGIAQTNYIADTEDRANSAHNSGCFGITPGQHIFWTPRTNPKWREIPGHGIAAYVGRSYMGHACPPAPATCLGFAAPTVEVRTAAGHTYAQTLRDGTDWGGTWYRV